MLNHVLIEPPSAFPKVMTHRPTKDNKVMVVLSHETLPGPLAQWVGALSGHAEAAGLIPGQDTGESANECTNTRNNKSALVSLSTTSKF